MSSYEEGFVDRSVESAWLQFRVRLAEHLVNLPQACRLNLRVDMGDRSATVVLRCWRDEDHRIGVGVLFDIDGELRQRPAPGLRRNGFRNGGRIVEPAQVDSLVWSVERWLRLSRSVPHPSFIEVTDGDLVLVDPPQDLVQPVVEPQIPECLTATSPDDLRLWVERVLTARLGHEPRLAKDGSFYVNTEAGQVAIRVGRRPVLDVWAIVARKVDVRRARKHVARMTARFHFFSFALVGDRVIVSTTVNAAPFCPEHLDRAITSTLEYLEHQAPDLQAKLGRREPDNGHAGVNAVDADLLLVFGAAGKHQAMVAMARGLTGDSRTRLTAWRDIATSHADEARSKAAAGEHGLVQNALIDQVIAWRSVANAMTDAVEAIVDTGAVS